MKNHTDLNLGEGLSILSSFHFSDSWIYHSIFTFDGVTVKTCIKVNVYGGVNLVCNHTCGFKIGRVRIESLDRFAQLFQHCWGHARLLRMVYKDLWVVSFPRCTASLNIVGSCCISLHTTANTHARTPKIVGATLLGVVASVCTQPKWSEFGLQSYAWF